MKIIDAEMIEKISTKDPIIIEGMVDSNDNITKLSTAIKENRNAKKVIIGKVSEDVLKAIIFGIHGNTGINTLALTSEMPTLRSIEVLHKTSKHLTTWELDINSEDMVAKLIAILADGQKTTTLSIKKEHAKYFLPKWPFNINQIVIDNFDAEFLDQLLALTPREANNKNIRISVQGSSTAIKRFEKSELFIQRNFTVTHDITMQLHLDEPEPAKEKSSTSTIIGNLNKTRKRILEDNNNNNSSAGTPLDKENNEVLDLTSPTKPSEKNTEPSIDKSQKAPALEKTTTPSIIDRDFFTNVKKVLKVTRKTPANERLELIKKWTAEAAKNKYLKQCLNHREKHYLSIAANLSLLETKTKQESNIHSKTKVIITTGERPSTDLSISSFESEITSDVDINQKIASLVKENEELERKIKEIEDNSAKLEKDYTSEIASLPSFAIVQPPSSKP